MNGARVTVVASYAKGLTMRVARMPVSGETLLSEGWDAGPGGKGSNQAVQAARLGADVRLVAAIGCDQFGDEAVALWASEGIDTTGVLRDPTLPTGVGFILVDAAGESRIALYPGANDALGEASVLKRLQISSKDVVLAGLEIPADAARAALSAAKNSGATTILNPAPAGRFDDGLLRLTDILVPNQSEARILLEEPPDSDSDEVELLRKLLRRGPRSVVMTRGHLGALVGDASGVHEVTPPPVSVVDTTGAGDAFCGALTTAIACGQDVVGAVRYACAAGAHACTKLGVEAGLGDQNAVTALMQA